MNAKISSILSESSSARAQWKQTQGSNPLSVQDIISTTLRRGDAYLLAMNVSKEERRARMGHSDSDSTYWSHYRNRTSTLDVQAIVHGVEALDMTMHSSVTLGRGERALQNGCLKRVIKR